MRLFEFASSDPLRVKLTSVVSQLKSRYMDTNSVEPPSVDTLLALLKKNDIIISKSDLFDMIKKEPLVNIIKDVKQNNVIFKGMKPHEDNMPDDDSEKIVSKMASKALK
jgi:hypothetical protein